MPTASRPRRARRRDSSSLNKTLNDGVGGPKDSSAGPSSREPMPMTWEFGKRCDENEKWAKVVKSRANPSIE